MATVIAKKSVAPPAPVKAAAPVPPAPRPAMTLVAPPAPAQQVAVAEPTAAEVVDDAAEDAADASAERKTRKDFATHEEFCDYKVQNAEANVIKWQGRVKLWQDKKTNKDADVLAKKQKKADKLIASWIETQRGMGVSEETIKEMVEMFKAKLAKQE